MLILGKRVLCLVLLLVVCFSLFAKNNNKKKNKKKKTEVVASVKPAVQEKPSLMLGSLLYEFESDGYMCQVRYIKREAYDIGYSKFKELVIDDPSLGFVYDSPEKRNIIWNLDFEQCMYILKFRIDKKMREGFVKDEKKTRCWLEIEQNGKVGWLEADYALKFFDTESVIPKMITFTYDGKTSRTYGYETSSALETCGDLTLYLDTNGSKQTGYIKEKGGYFYITMIGYSPDAKKYSKDWFLVEHTDSEGNIQKGWCMIPDDLQRGGVLYRDVYFYLTVFFSCF